MFLDFSERIQWLVAEAVLLSEPNRMGMRFGIISTANFAQVALIPAIRKAGHEVTAIGSRDRSRAEAVADRFGIERAYGSYEALFEDDTIEAVYNPTPHSEHAKWSMRAADHGLHVLCEKPMAVSADEAREMADHCEAAGVVLMEALMYRYHPRTERAVEIVETEFDEVRSVTGSFHGYRSRDTKLDPELKRGSLLEIGCYPITAAKGFLGVPDRVYAEVSDSLGYGLDTDTRALLAYPNGVTAHVSSSFDSTHREHYRVDATNGWLVVEEAYAPSPRSAPDGVDPVETTLRYRVDGREGVETFEPVDQFALEVEHFVECISEGRTPRTDGHSAVDTLRICDAILESGNRGTPVYLA